MVMIKTNLRRNGGYEVIETKIKADAKATAQSDEVERMIEEINRRTKIPFHPDFSTSKDDMLQEGQSSSDRHS